MRRTRYGEAWVQCKEIFDQAMAALAIGTPCRNLQAMTLDYFERKGHPTMRTHPGGHDGYVHSLGHGLGLDIHEEPRLSVAAGNATLLQAGHVVSVEPGLYYPERGFGVRIEDTVALDREWYARQSVTLPVRSGHPDEQVDSTAGLPGRVCDPGRPA